jgi:Tfp pilus assembly PilM family ATPase
MNNPSVYIEIGHNSLRALHEARVIDLPLERLDNGRLSPACKQKLEAGLRGLFQRKSWQPKLRAVVAVGIRGVAARRLTLPPSSREELARVLALQLEAEFPMPPADLAWGWRLLGPAANAAGQEALIVAVRKEAIEEYASLLSACGAQPSFTVGALVRRGLCPREFGPCAMLDLGRVESELAVFEDGVPVSLRVLPWGGENITSALASRLGLGFDEAEKLKLRLDQEPDTGGERRQAIDSALDEAFDRLAGLLNGGATGRKLYLTGATTRCRRIQSRLAQRLSSTWTIETIDSTADAGTSATLSGLKRTVEQNAGAPPIQLNLKETQNGETWSVQRAPVKLAALAAGLALAILLLPFAEALALKPLLNRRLGELTSETNRLTTIDREQGFLEYLKQSQPPYLDTIYILANSAPPGSRIDSLSMNRHGDLTLRGSMHDSQQVVDFRAKLINSGLFASVAVDEQTPSQDHQKLDVRITAQLKAVNARGKIKLEEPAASGAPPNAAEIAPKPANPPSPQSVAPPVGQPGSPPAKSPDGSPAGPPAHERHPRPPNQTDPSGPQPPAAIPARV